MIRSVFDTYGPVVLVPVFLLLLWLETKFQLRRRVQRRWKRIWVNFIVSLPAFMLLRWLVIPFTVWLALENQSWQIGLIYLFDAAPPVHFAIAFLLLDYSNYAWHILLHKWPLLWRFHLVHHTDLDLDVSTAFRFHFGELIATVVFRGMVILLTGATAFHILLFEIFFEAATQFHHSNLKMPYQLERWLNYIIVTPRMHGIHHSQIKKETDSNYSIIFSFWDRVHRTARLNVPQQDVVTGVPGYADEKELTIGMLLKLPFTAIRPWKEKPAPRSGNPDKLSK